MECHQVISVAAKAEDVIVARTPVAISVFIMFIRGDLSKKGGLMLTTLHDSRVTLAVLLALGKGNACGHAARKPKTSQEMGIGFYYFCYGCYGCCRYDCLATPRRIGPGTGPACRWHTRKSTTVRKRRREL
ncbi:hypothetical protein [uncultured Herbaspirillum sp.]|uniref:hypothetical protein n=1 Tax=uncultured Herbaspirillum sp. TaxID=160236 RepID=UPI00260A2B71|nr:hypothetical protein [uncultured Herbaspirillum sp.]